jgi:diacylglycerol kinase family enzyme
MHEPSTTQRSHIAPSPRRYAVLLNARAKGWRGSVHEAAQRYVPREDLFLTESFHQAERTVSKLLDADYDVIFTGGGDGTVVYLINKLEEHIRAGHVKRDEAPLVGLLRLGTGNALATYLGSDQIIRDLSALRSGSRLIVHEVNMVEGPEGLFPFAGFGWDADILNDYELLKATVRDTTVEDYMTGLGGYALAIGTRTLPRLLNSPMIEVKVTNTGDVAKRINYEGETLREYGLGEIMYEGPAHICGCASIPYWGFNVRMFPQADRWADLFQLRVYHGGVTEILGGLRSFWRGKVREASIFDAMVRSVHIELLGEPMPIQVSGDVSGVERQLEWQLAPHPVRLAIPLAT